jgi:hypothetical protein
VSCATTNTGPRLRATLEMLSPECPALEVDLSDWEGGADDEAPSPRLSSASGAKFHALTEISLRL